MCPDNPKSSDAGAPHLAGRRRLLLVFVNGAIAGIGGALATLLGVFAVRPARAAAKERWVRAAASHDLAAGMPLTRVLSVAREDGWYRERRRQTVFLLRDGESVRAFSATCTHLGCQVRWDSAARKFLCPCHGGAYALDGTVLEGPPPRPLDRIEVRLNPADGAVLVRV